MTNAINWFEIPVTDFTRAKQFYETILSAEMQGMEMPVCNQLSFLPTFKKVLVAA